ncbi:glycosyltransferase family 4 protein [Streptomyces sp. NPDC101165]|uniref:glycosyltransferase family 4 protein n=1 Tax=Streptomyces sp. NPDC101165 TaxID=3366119 RepID=UPI00382DF059
MKIAVVHSFYASGQPSGENVVVRDQVRALRGAGHDVELFAAHTDELARDPFYALRAAARVASGRGHNPLARLRAYGPDIVHVHNLFPNFGRSWVREWQGPLVATLHNFRPLCAVATLYREGAVCTRCPDGDRWAGMRYGCYRGSRVTTFPLSWAGRHGLAADPLLARADQLVVLSALSRRTYARAGVPHDRLALVPNFVPGPRREEVPAANGRWMVAARLTAEKGVLELLRQWPGEQPLDVVGDGELLAACQAEAPSSVRFLGHLDRDDLRRRMPSWRGLVFPSRWYEGAVPLVYIEGLAAGLPVIAFEGSAVAEAVRGNGTGFVTQWDRPLDRLLDEAGATFPELRAHCRQVYANHFSKSAWITRIDRTYEDAARVTYGRTATAVEMSASEATDS